VVISACKALINAAFEIKEKEAIYKENKYFLPQDTYVSMKQRRHAL